MNSVHFYLLNQVERVNFEKKNLEKILNTIPLNLIGFDTNTNSLISLPPNINRVHKLLRELLLNQINRVKLEEEQLVLLQNNLSIDEFEDLLIMTQDKKIKFEKDFYDKYLQFKL